jgi:hypothetical protein
MIRECLTYFLSSILEFQRIKIQTTCFCEQFSDFFRLFFQGKKNLIKRKNPLRKGISVLLWGRRGWGGVKRQAGIFEESMP